MIPPDLLEVVKMGLGGGATAILSCLLGLTLYALLWRQPKHEEARDKSHQQERALLLKLAQDDREKFADIVSDLSAKAEMALQRNTEAITKLEAAVERLDIRIDTHDRILSRRESA